MLKYQRMALLQNLEKSRKGAKPVGAEKIMANGVANGC